MKETEKALIDCIILVLSGLWADTDWAMVTVFSGSLQSRGWLVPADIIPVIELLDSVWMGWNGMTQSNRSLALDVSDTLASPICVAIDSFMDYLRSGLVEHNAELVGLIGDNSGWDDNLPRL